MKKFWKVLGITAAVAALAPYRVGKDEETGETKVQALLWQATAGPKDGEEKMAVDVSFGFNSPFAAKAEEPFFDEEPVAEFTVDPEDVEETCAEEDGADAEAEIEAIENATEADQENSEETDPAVQE